MYYGQLLKTCLTDGPGVRVSLYCSGCRIHCRGCHNPDSWSFNFGKEYTNDTEKEIIEALSKDYISGLTLCGGEPTEPENLEILTNLAKKVKELFPTKTIWLYSGHEYEEIKDLELLKYIDVAVVGPFILELRDISVNNKWRGSTNQRIIEVKHE